MSSGTSPGSPDGERRSGADAFDEAPILLDRPRQNTQVDGAITNLNTTARAVRAAHEHDIEECAALSMAVDGHARAAELRSSHHCRHGLDCRTARAHHWLRDGVRIRVAHRRGEQRRNDRHAQLRTDVHGARHSRTVTQWRTAQQLSFKPEVQEPLAPLLLTESQVCELLGIGRTTLRSLPLRPKHINRCVRYLASDVERYVAELT
jgi:hypothetical protein